MCWGSAHPAVGAQVCLVHPLLTFQRVAAFGLAARWRFGRADRGAMGRLKQIPARLKAPPPKVKALPKVADPFYLSPEWRTLVRDIKRERGAFCCICGSGKRIVGDHRVELKDGGARLDPANVDLLCHGCHQRKTARERARRAVGQSGDRGVVESLGGSRR
jgi:hypothetical protein